MKIYIAFLQILPGKNLNENLIIGKPLILMVEKDKNAQKLSDMISRKEGEEQ